MYKCAARAAASYIDSINARRCRRVRFSGYLHTHTQTLMQYFAFVHRKDIISTHTHTNDTANINFAAAKMKTTTADRSAVSISFDGAVS